MFYNVRVIGISLFWLFSTLLASATVIAQSSSEEGAPAPNLGSVIDRLETAFTRTGDVAIAYHLARVSFGHGDYEAAGKWLTKLDGAGWKMGLDPANFSGDAIPDVLLRQIANINKATSQSLRASTHALTFDDRLLVPESIAYDAENRTVYAGSLLVPRLVKTTLQGKGKASKNIEVALPEGVEWGVLYGIKFNADRGDLWLLNNRTDSEGMHGNLSVINREGALIKSYHFAGEPAVELNDLCFSGDYAYVTDSTASRIYRGSLASDSLEVFYQNSDISFPNGIACSDNSTAVYVSDSRGVSRIDQGGIGHGRLKVKAGFSLGGIDGMYLWSDHIVGVQNYLGAPKIIMVNLGKPAASNAVNFFDVNHPNYRVPTTGFVTGDCLFYIANSSLDALGRDGALDPSSPRPNRANVQALNLRKAGGSCDPQ